MPTPGLSPLAIIVPFPIILDLLPYQETAGKLERLASKVHGRHFLACPAFGRPHAAAARELVFAISGSYHAKKRAAHMLVPALGRKVMDLGSNVEKAASFKLCGNGLIVGMIEVLAETFTLGELSFYLSLQNPSSSV
jgi:3-hydroxyisobutyrate dehydrogenase-like beta-hydroxyacid dehydrogenase